MKKTARGYRRNLNSLQSDMDETNAQMQDAMRERDRHLSNAESDEFKGKDKRAKRSRDAAARYDIEVKSLEAKNKAIEEQVNKILKEAKNNGILVKSINVERTINTLPVETQLELQDLGLYGYGFVSSFDHKVKSKEYMTRIQ